MSKQLDDLLSWGWTRDLSPRVPRCGMQRPGYARGELCERPARWIHPTGRPIQLCASHARWWHLHVDAMAGEL